jgi:CheY-like chemotaxis protein
MLFLNWTESGGPHVGVPAKLGFGTKIISSLGGGRRGRTNFDWLASGLNFTLELRYEEAAHRSNGAAHDTRVVRHDGDSRLLLVEDELVVGLFMQDLLKAIGYRPTDPIGRLSEAIHAATHERFAGAILDMNLNGEIVYPLAELLTQQRVPFLFVTGYAPGSLDPRFNQVPILQKPVVQDELAGALNLVLKSRSEALSAASR